MTASVKDTALTLSNLSTNERAWFWLCTDASPALIIQPVTAPGGVGQLRQIAGTIPRSGSAPQIAGMAAISEDGQLRLCGQRLSRETLEGLAQWVGDNIKANPLLARVNNAALMSTDPRGRVLESFEDSSLWPKPRVEKALPPPPDSLSECGAYVASMIEQGGSAWIWMSAQGPGNTPAAVVVPSRQDRKGAQFIGKVKAMMQRAGRPCPGFIGVLRCSGRGQNLLLTKNNIATMDDIRTALVAQAPGFETLKDVWLLQMGARPEARGPGASGPDLSAQSMALSTLRPNQTVWFWLQTDGEETHVELAASRPVLKQIIQAHRRAGARSVMGKLRLNSRQIPTFLTRSTFEDFLPVLAGWVGQHHESSPALLRLLGARLMVKDSDGNVLARVADGEAWEKVR